MSYLFTSERLGFRNWQHYDVESMAAINSDPQVMEFFPGVLSLQETSDFISRMQEQFSKTGYCYFAVDKIDENEFIGFIGLSDKTFAADFTPCVDIGWRLKSSAWGNGNATEGAKRCLEYGFNELKLNKIFAMAPVINLKSEKIMQKIGMTKVKTFLHPLLANDERLGECLLYEKKNKH